MRLQGRLRFVALTLAVTVTLSFSSAPACADYVFNSLSLEGFTGILNTPNAHVGDHGSLHLLFTDHVNEEFRNQIGQYDKNYLFSLGLYNFFEVGGRLFKDHRDLSANIKFSTAPLSADNPLLPVLAVGLQDVGGGSTFFQTKYFVVSHDIWRFRLSAGYGTGPDRMKGAFGGAELKACDWMYLLGEYDTKETNVGVRLVTLPFWKIPARFTATAKTSLNRNPEKINIGVGLILPLDFKIKPAATSLREEDTALEDTAFSSASPVPEASKPPGIATPPSIAAPLSVDSPVGSSSAPSRGQGGDRHEILAAMRDQLVQEGFTNVRTGATVDGTLVVEYENVRFNHSEMDGMGVVAGMVVGLAQGHFDSLRMVVKKHDIPMVQLSMPVSVLKGFLERNVGKDDFSELLSISYAISEDDAVFVPGKGNPGFLKSSLLMYPGLITFVGTEHGLFDYLLSVRPELLVNAWRGGIFDARWDIPISWSENLNDGKVFGDSRHSSRLDRLMFFQAVKPFPSLMANIGAGMLVPEVYGTQNEVIWSPGDGRHRFRGAQAYGEHAKSEKTITSYLGSYRYYSPSLDLYLEGTAGQFWEDDKGFAVELKHLFGDTAVSLYYKNTRGGDDKRWEAVGIQFAFPLTSRKDMKHLYAMQLRGTEEWSYAQETTLKNTNSDDGRGSLNYLAPYPLAVNPQRTPALPRMYYDRDRLGEAYMREHLERLREAWLWFSSGRVPVQRP